MWRINLRRQYLVSASCRIARLNSATISVPITFFFYLMGKLPPIGIWISSLWTFRGQDCVVLNATVVQFGKWLLWLGIHLGRHCNVLVDSVSGSKGWASRRKPRMTKGVWAKRRTRKKDPAWSSCWAKWRSKWSSGSETSTSTRTAFWKSSLTRRTMAVSRQHRTIDRTCIDCFCVLCLRCWLIRGGELQSHEEVDERHQIDRQGSEELFCAGGNVQQSPASAFE